MERGTQGTGLFGTNWLPSLFDDDDVEVRNSRGMLSAINGKANQRGEIFQGVDEAKRAKNRAKNKAARKARAKARR